MLAGRVVTFDISASWAVIGEARPGTRMRVGPQAEVASWRSGMTRPSRRGGACGWKGCRDGLR